MKIYWFVDDNGKIGNFISKAFIPIGTILGVNDGFEIRTKIIDCYIVGSK